MHPEKVQGRERLKKTTTRTGVSAHRYARTLPQGLSNVSSRHHRLRTRQHQTSTVLHENLYSCEHWMSICVQNSYNQLCGNTRLFHSQQGPTKNVQSVLQLNHHASAHIWCSIPQVSPHFLPRSTSRAFKVLSLPNSGACTFGIASREGGQSSFRETFRRNSMLIASAFLDEMQVFIDGNVTRA